MTRTALLCINGAWRDDVRPIWSQPSMPRVALVNSRPLRLDINLRWVPRKCSLSSSLRILRCAAGDSAEEESPKRLAQPTQRLSRLHNVLIFPMFQPERDIIIHQENEEKFPSPPAPLAEVLEAETFETQMNMSLEEQKSVNLTTYLQRSAQKKHATATSNRSTSLQSCSLINFSWEILDDSRCFKMVV